MSRVLRACTKSGTTVAVAGIAAMATGVLAAPAMADPSGHNPSGHNGDIKIIAVDDLSTPPENNPMQGCTLAIEWYNLDAGDDLFSQVSFETISPTGDAELTVVGLLEVPVGGDDAGGGNDLDAREEYTFAATGDPGPHGFHIKVTVQTPGSHGPEKKSKVFWIADCSEEPTTEEPPVEEPPVEEPPVEEPPKEEPPTEEPPTEEPPVDEPPAEEPPAEEPPVETPVVDPKHPEEVQVDAVLDPAPVLVPAAADVPTLVDAGATADGIGDGTRHGFVILGGLLIASGVLLRRSSRGFRG